jgi:hypothetical protein
LSRWNGIRAARPVGETSAGWREERYLKVSMETQWCRMAADLFFSGVEGGAMALSGGEPVFQ